MIRESDLDRWLEGLPAESPESRMLRLWSRSASDDVRVAIETGGSITDGKADATDPVEAESDD